MSKKAAIKPKEQNSKFDRALFVVNAKATNARRAKKFWKDVQRYVGSDNCEVIDISKLTYVASRQAVIKALKECTSRSIVCVGGGDGTVSMVVGLLSNESSLSPDSRASGLLPMWGGNANDMAVMLNGLPSTANIRKILKSSKHVPVYPLQIDISEPGKNVKTHIAGCYASFGATAEALARMELSAHDRTASGSSKKLTRIVHEFKDIKKIYFNMRPIKLEPDSEKTVELYDRLFVNGSRYAKILRSPIDLHEPRYFVLSSREKKWWYLALRTLRPLAMKAGGKISDKSRSFMLKDQTYMQVDGEVFKLKPNTTVKVSIGETPFIVISTKLHA